MDNSALGRLPVELRIRIFEHFLIDDPPGGIGLMASKDGATLKRTSSSASTSGHYVGAVSRACKQLREEALPVYYGGNSFVAHCPGIFLPVGIETRDCEAAAQRIRCITGWKQSIGNAAEHIRKFEVDMGNWSHATNSEFYTLNLCELAKLLPDPRVQLSCRWNRTWQSLQPGSHHMNFKLTRGGTDELRVQIDAEEREKAQTIEISGPRAKAKKERMRLELKVAMTMLRDFCDLIDQDPMWEKCSRGDLPLDTSPAEQEKAITKSIKQR